MKSNDKLEAYGRNLRNELALDELGPHVPDRRFLRIRTRPNGGTA